MELLGNSDIPISDMPATKIPIAVVGLGFGRWIIKNQLLSGSGSSYFQLAGICDVDPKRVAIASEAFGVRAYRDLDEILADPSIPVIGLFTGPFSRAKLIRKIIRAGKDVMTTKPFEIDPEAALSVLKEARDLGRVIHLNSPTPIPARDIRQIIEWRNKFDLGNPIGCRADVWAAYAEQADGSWYDDPERCPVAPIFRLGIYLINDLTILLGEPEDVHVFASRIATGRPTPDTAQLGIRFANGALANVFASFCVKDGDYYRNSLVLNFQNGTVYRNVGSSRSGGESSELSLVMERDGKREIIAQAEIPESGHYNYMWDVLYRAIRGERSPGEITPEQMVAGLKVIQAMTKAQQISGGVLSIDQ